MSISILTFYIINNAFKNTEYILTYSALYDKVYIAKQRES